MKKTPSRLGNSVTFLVELCFCFQSGAETATFGVKVVHVQHGCTCSIQRTPLHNLNSCLVIILCIGTNHNDLLTPKLLVVVLINQMLPTSSYKLSQSLGVEKASCASVQFDVFIAVYNGDV